jgi:hydroxyacyl-ACP dehydratase HTD2-like protein with hotdog domain
VREAERIVHSVPAMMPLQLRQYCEAIGDPNPVHVSREAARASGLTDVVLPGSLQAVLLLGAVHERYPQRPAVISIRFKQWAYAHEPLTVRWEGEDRLTLLAPDGRVCSILRIRGADPRPCSADTCRASADEEHG